MDSVGLSRYNPMVGYPRGKPARTFFVGNPHDAMQQEVWPLWVPTVRNVTWTSDQAATEAARLIADLGLAEAAIAVELPFLAADAYQTLRKLLPKAQIVDAVLLLEELRAVKQPWELQLLKEASENIVESMLATLRRARPGMTTGQIADLLRREEMDRDLAFDYCLVAAGASVNRIPSAARWEHGASLSLDSGGNKRGYIGDLARMAVMGRQAPEQEALLREIETVQMAARVPIRAGALGREIYDRAHAALADCAHGAEIDFLAHGMGLVSHEAPRLTGSGPVPYPADHADKPLEAGMVISIESTLVSPSHGYIKLEDTIAVTATGWEAYGDTAHGWNMAGD
jgi:Xaa-Pro aminopeptidase